MNILILSVTAGEGHNSTARAMRDYFTEQGVECEVLDTYGYVSPTVAKSINKSYLWVSSKAKSAWGFGYSLAERRRPMKEEHEQLMAQILSMPFLGEIEDYIEKSAPSAILFTHPFSGAILSVLRREGKIRVPTVGILTDFVFHPFWEDAVQNDYVVIPSASLSRQGQRKGFREAQLLPLGIPIHPKFALSQPKEEARRSLGLDPGKKTVLLMGGSMGYGNLADTVAALDALPAELPMQIVVVCGNNSRARGEIAQLQTKRQVLCLGFVNYIDRLMDAADIIVTKPGGLTTSEALAKRLPMVIVNPIPGQETRNAEFLLNHGAAVAVTDVCPPEELVGQLLASEERLAAMRMCVDAIRHPESTREVCEFVLRRCAIPT